MIHADDECRRTYGVDVGHEPSQLLGRFVVAREEDHAADVMLAQIADDERGVGRGAAAEAEQQTELVHFQQIAEFRRIRARQQLIELMQGAWILELPELTGFQRSDVQAIKAFISRQKDRARLAYAAYVGFLQLSLQLGQPRLHRDELDRVQREARELKLVALGRLTAGIAHEIRNPLGAISHAAQLLSESPKLEQTLGWLAHSSYDQLASKLKYGSFIFVGVLIAVVVLFSLGKKRLEAKAQALIESSQAAEAAVAGGVKLGSETGSCRKDICGNSVRKGIAPGRSKK